VLPPGGLGVACGDAGGDRSSEVDEPVDGAAPGPNRSNDLDDAGGALGADRSSDDEFACSATRGCGA